MSAGIRPSSDAPVDNYYYQPWWVREAIRTTEILRKVDLTFLSAKDVDSLHDLRAALEENLPTNNKSN